MTFSGIIVAAGSGSRAGGDKQWRLLGGKPVLRWSAEAMRDAGAAELIVVVVPGAEDRAAMALNGLTGWRAVAGGDNRADSVRAGLAALTCTPDRPVLIHDAARPLLSAEIIGRLVMALETADGALPALAVADSLRKAQDGAVTQAVTREDLWRAQTPQAFRRGVIEAAYAAWPDPDAPADEAMVVQRAGGRVVLVPGDPRLLKLTFPEDFAMAEALLSQDAPRYQTRIGSGYDVHRWGPGGPVRLCGIEVPHDQTLIGHSDADAGLHALTDAILGAIAAGDIGDHFPPTDPKWKGASSDQFLIHAAELTAQRGGRIVNVDITLICERPKVKPHRQAMRDRIAALLDLPLDAVSVKATTTEGLGFTGRGEGLAAQAVVAVEMPVRQRE
ncbi:Bifunctional enzyme IspD/IspF [Brevundimonas sp. SH203]|uniref:bifunctional 2-C-methyl-D-erythritol 4-phosphate cytidylyltransferase/2-C-methyl-D-erythritol 2,4-cyclodiphosphate synthase n=1 Tax=Brevundimonas sp. SH203 TaxID=345167 RepID=UPI0009C4F16F|nr:bifunctional 2-C-methyl-D-erythritol 4-phosphate cytidylyltransferase/2-C-methyl-D-erythritol 2,4-cyclodiphosphate synthase [Brevundimonas sp. SH203]GAW39677.1 Bifunctional enzyme IspD/IspF [Brevundimonas sp. SH203]